MAVYRLADGATEVRVEQDASWGLGGECWDGAFLLSQFLDDTRAAEGRAVLELGAGTGLLAMVAAATGAARVCATDEFVENLEANGVPAARLRWGSEEDLAAVGGGWQLVIGSDIAFSGVLHPVLAATLGALLRADGCEGALLAMDSCGPACAGDCPLPPCRCPDGASCAPNPCKRRPKPCSTTAFCRVLGPDFGHRVERRARMLDCPSLLAWRKYAPDEEDEMLVVRFWRMGGEAGAAGGGVAGGGVEAGAVAQ